MIWRVALQIQYAWIGEHSAMIAHGWNTWDVNHVNGLVHLPCGLCACFRLFNPVSGELKEAFDWRNDLRQLGPHAADGSYLQIGLQWQGAQITFEAAHQGDILVCRVAAAGPTTLRKVASTLRKVASTLRKVASTLQVRVSLERAWGQPLAVGQAQPSTGHEAQPSTGHEALAELSAEVDGMVWRLAPVSPSGAAAQGTVLSFGLEQPAVFWVAPAEMRAAFTPNSLLALLETQRLAYQQTCLQSSGWLQDAAAGITRALHWNTIWEPIKGRVCTPVSREWCVNSHWGGYVLFDWDTFFGALMAGLEEPALAAANLRAMLQEITPDGFVPNFGAERIVSLDRSQPPVGAYCLLKLYQGGQMCTGGGSAGHPIDRALLQEAFPALLRWHAWWLPRRDGNGDGLLEWGSDPRPNTHGWEVDTLRAAMYESGLDNSPMYDEVTFNAVAHTMELADVGLNALFALDAWALSEIACLLGLTEEAERLALEYARMGERINAQLWNEAAGIYQNRHWDGRFSPHLSPTNFYPLLAGIVPAERARRMLSEHLLNEEEFWGRFVLPSIARNDPGYHQQELRRDNIAQTIGEYWRGRIWGPMNFLVSEGLHRYGFDAEAHEFAQRSLTLFLQEWQGQAHVHENYHDLTGEGDDVQNSNPLYHWGALLAYIAVQELADAEAWGGWRFGSLSSAPAKIAGIRVREGRLDVENGTAGLKVWLNSRIWLACDRPALIRGCRREQTRLTFQLQTDADGVCLEIGQMPPETRVSVKWQPVDQPESGVEQTAFTDTSGQMRLMQALPGLWSLAWEPAFGG